MNNNKKRRHNDEENVIIMTFNHTLLVLYAYDPIYRDCCTAFLRGIHSLSDILGFKKLVLKLIAKFN